MIDRRAVITGTAALLAAPAAYAQELPAWRLRELVATSSFVVTGVMRPPQPRPTRRTPNDYAEIPVFAVVALKGSPPTPQLAFRHTLIDPGIFNTIVPWTLAGEPAILFLREETRGAGTTLVLTWEDAAYKATPELLDAVKREIAAQAAGP